MARVENPLRRDAVTGTGSFMDARGDAEVVRDSVTLLSPEDGGTATLTIASIASSMWSASAVQRLPT